MIELLVVIFLIALLMGLSVPPLVGIRRQAQTTVCSARIRQLTLGLSSYQAQNATFPCGFQPVGISVASPSSAGIVGLLEPLGRWWIDCSEKVNHKTGEGLEALVCPSKRQEDPRLATDVLCGNYGVNLSICRVTQYMKPYRDGFYGMPLSADQIVRPSETLLLVDSGYTLISWWHATDESPVEIPASPLPMVGAMQHTAYVPGGDQPQQAALDRPDRGCHRGPASGPERERGVCRRPRGSDEGGRAVRGEDGRRRMELLSAVAAEPGTCHSTASSSVRTFSICGASRYSKTVVVRGLHSPCGSRS